jgi:uncharacterized protein
MVEKSARRRNFSGQALGIFAKEPLPGQVKTRFSPPLSSVEAAELYRVSLAETIERMTGLGVPLTLFYAGGREFFATNFPGLCLRPQAEGDLGRRMSAALEQLLDDGCRGAALIGSDSPDLPPTLIREAFAALDEAECVTAPAGDGGYVLIGLTRAASALFRDIPWSTERVLQATRERARDMGLGYREVAGWEDLDDLPALSRLLVRSPDSLTARFVRSRLAAYLPPS